MTDEGNTAVTVEFSQDEYDRLESIGDDAPALIHEAAIDRLELEEAIEYTQDGGFRGPNRFPKLAQDEYPAWPLGSLLGIDLQSMGDGESRWTMDAGAPHTNPMGTVHGGVLCDLGDAALGTAYMSTLEAGELFATVNLTIHFLRPVRNDHLDAVGRVVHKGRNVGVAESEITNEDGQLVAKLSGTCMTLGKEEP